VSHRPQPVTPSRGEVGVARYDIPHLWLARQRPLLPGSRTSRGVGTGRSGW